MGRDFAVGPRYAIGRCVSKAPWLATALGVLTIFVLRFMGFELSYWPEVGAGVTVAAIVGLWVRAERAAKRSARQGLVSQLVSYAQGRSVQSLVVFILGGMVFGGLIGVAVWAMLPRAAPTAQVTAPSPPQAQPNLYVSFARVGRIPDAPPGQELHLLRLRSEKDTEGFVIDDPTPNDPPSQQTYRCRVVNRGPALQEVRIEVFAVFFDDVKPRGQSSRGQQYQISIPALGPGAEFVLYVRNDSPGGTTLHLPSDAPALVTASGDTTKIPLVWKAENTSERGQPPFLDFDAAK